MPGLSVSAQDKTDAETASSELLTALKEGAFYLVAEDTVEIDDTVAAASEGALASFKNVLKAAALVAFRRRTVTGFAGPETPGGSITGTTGSDGNAVFTLANTPQGLLLVKTGVVLLEGTHFTRSGNQITYLAPHIPIAGNDWHAGWYRY